MPSSFTTSASAPAGVSPASRARSTAASVWPGRTSTPPSRARSGKMWPGLTSSNGSVAESARVRIVRARSAALMPVVTPSRASTLIVYAVRMRSRLSWHHQRQPEPVEVLAAHADADDAGGGAGS